MSIPQGEVKFKCFEDAAPLRVILTHHHFLFEKRYSDLFQQIWKSKLDAAMHAKFSVALNFEDVITRIWKPVFSNCCQLVDNVRSRSITLKEVDLYFLKIEVTEVCRHLRNLYIAVELCRDKKAEEFEWIQGSVDLMKQYWDLCKQAKAAKIVLNLKNDLKLTGDFEIIENVASTVEKSMMDASLESISKSNIKEAKSFLDNFNTEDKKKLECLEQFAACLNIVEWMRKETKG